MPQYNPPSPDASGGEPSGPAGGQLSGTYPDPSVAASHSGSTHAATQAAAEATAAAAAALHAATPHAGAVAAEDVSIADAGNDFTATDVEGALAEIQADNEAHVAAADPHTGYRLESADHTHASSGAQAGQVDHGALGGLADDDHPQYATDTDLTTHAGAVDPHSVYRLESADHSHASTGLQAGTIDHGVITGLSDDDHPQYALDTDLTTHTGAVDPHSVYRLESADHSHVSTGLQAGTVDHGAITGLTDDDHTQYVLESLFDAKGDIIAASADNTPAKVTVGANDTVLTADNTQAAGVRWAAPGASSTNIKATEQDFGATLVGYKEWTITDADVTAASNIRAYLSAEVPTGRDGDEAEMEPMHVWAIDMAAGSFTLIAEVIDGPVEGKYVFNYLIG